MTIKRKMRMKRCQDGVFRTLVTFPLPLRDRMMKYLDHCGGVPIAEFLRRTVDDKLASAGF